MTARATQIRESKQNQIHAAFVRVAEETINGFARGFFLFAFHAAGEEMKAHMIFDDDLQTLDFIIAEIQSMCSFDRDLRA